MWRLRYHLITRRRSIWCQSIGSITTIACFMLRRNEEIGRKEKFCNVPNPICVCRFVSFKKFHMHRFSIQHRQQFFHGAIQTGTETGQLLEGTGAKGNSPTVAVLVACFGVFGFVGSREETSFFVFETAWFTLRHRLHQGCQVCRQR